MTSLQENNPEILHLANFPLYQAFYFESMLMLTKTALAALQDLNEALEIIYSLETEDEFNRFDISSILNPAQSIVIQAASLSRYFWPARTKVEIHTARASFLRQKFELEEGCPLKSRDLRNLIEHFDEKLDNYLANGIVGNVIPQFVGDLSGQREVPAHLFRAYDPQTSIFEVLGHQFSLEPIVNTIDGIHKKLVSLCRVNSSS